MTITHSPLVLWTLGFTLCSHSPFNCLTHRGCLIFLSRIVPSAADLNCLSVQAVKRLFSVRFATWLPSHIFCFNRRAPFFIKTALVLRSGLEPPSLTAGDFLTTLCHHSQLNCCSLDLVFTISFRT